MPTSLSNTLLLLKLLCSLLSTFTYVLTLSTFFIAAIKAFKWAVAALNITVDAFTVNYAVVISTLANTAWSFTFLNSSYALAVFFFITILDAVSKAFCCNNSDCLNSSRKAGILLNEDKISIVLSKLSDTYRW